MRSRAVSSGNANLAPTLGSNVVLADGVEARLIEAEAALAASDIDTWLAKLNALRAAVRSLMVARYESYEAHVPGPNNPDATLEPLTDPGDAAARLDLMLRERAFWLFNTGHRLGDMRRMIRSWGHTADAVFPSGAYHKGGTYGPDVNFPVPFNETQNPKLHDRTVRHTDGVSPRPAGSRGVRGAPDSGVPRASPPPWCISPLSGATG